MIWVETNQIMCYCYQNTLGEFKAVHLIRYFDSTPKTDAFIYSLLNMISKNIHGVSLGDQKLQRKRNILVIDVKKK